MGLNQGGDGMNGETKTKMRDYRGKISRTKQLSGYKGAMKKMLTYKFNMQSASEFCFLN